MKTLPSETFAIEVIFGHIQLDQHIMEMAAEAEKEQNHWPRTSGTELIGTKKDLVRLLAIEDTGTNSQLTLER